MSFGRDYPEDYTTVTILFTTQDGNGAPVAPLTGFEAADVTIYKNGATAKTTTNGVTMTSPLNSKTGLHAVIIDTSNDTGDSGFWTTGGGSMYSVVLDPDTETVNGQTVRKVIGDFSICVPPALRPTVAARTLDIASTGEAGLDFSNVLGTTGTNLQKTTQSVARGTVTTGASTTSIPTSALTIAGSAASGVVADQFKNRVVLFDGDTTTAGLKGVAATISASSASNTPTFTVGTLPATPASGDTFSVI